MAIRINGVTGSKLDASVSTVYSFTTTTTGIVTYAWSIVSAPPGNTAALVNASTATAQLTPSNEGTYLVRLTATTGAGTVQETAVLAVPSITSGLRVPAYAEVLEAGATGWDQGAGNMLRSLDLYREQAGVIACVADGTIAPGTPVTVAVDPADPMFSVGASVKLSGLPGERSLPKAFSGITPYVPLVGIAIGTTSGGTASAGDVVLVRVSGLYQGLSVTYGALSSDYPFLFPDGSGGLTATPPTSENNSRCVGKIVRWSSGTPGVGSVVDIMVYGDRVPRSHSIQFGSDGSALATTKRYLPPGSGAATTDYVGQFMAIPGDAPVILSRMRVYTPTTTTVTTKIEVVYANTGPTGLTGEQELLLGVKSVDFSTWIPIDRDEPIGVSARHPAGTGPLWLSVTLELLEL